MDWLDDSFFEDFTASQLDGVSDDEYFDHITDYDLDADNYQYGGTLGPVNLFDILDFDKLVKLGKSTITNTKFNITHHLYEVNIGKLPANFSNETSLRIIPLVFEQLLKICTGTFEPNDRILIELACQDLDNPVYLHCKKFKDYSVQDLYDKLLLINSQKKFKIDDTFTIRVTRSVMPAGGSGKRRFHHDTESRKRFAGSIVAVKVDKNLCLPAALFLGHFRLTHSIKQGQQDYRTWKNLTDNRNTKKLETFATDTVTAAGFTVGRVFSYMDDLDIFQAKVFTEYQLVVVDEQQGNVVMRRCPEKGNLPEIWLYYNRKHFDLITSDTGFYRSSYYCRSCEKPYHIKSQHRCGGKCHLCYRYLTDCIEIKKIKCEKCLRVFRNEGCFNTHNEVKNNGTSYCDEIFVCAKCNRFINLTKKTGEKKHECGKFYCQTCKDFVIEHQHKCYMLVTQPRIVNDNPKYVFFDYEAYKDPVTSTHIPNLVIAQLSDGTEFRFPPDGSPMKPDYDVTKHFCKFFFREEYEGYTFISHNGRFYDLQFILQYMIDNNYKIKTIKRGTKIIDLRYDALKIRFRDTMNYVASSLANLPRAVGLDPKIVAKGDFPHRANVPDNWDRVIPYPDLNMYMIEKWPQLKRTEFAKWYEVDKMEKNNFYNLRYEITSYCSNDVTTLRLSALKLRENFIKLTKCDLFEDITIASACRRFYSTYLMKPNSIGVISAHGYLGANRPTSIQATEYFEYMNHFETNNRINHGRVGKEIKIGNYFVDGVDETTHTLYEVNGCIFHGHSVCTDPKRPCTVPSHNHEYGTGRNGTKKNFFGKMWLARGLYLDM